MAPRANWKGFLKVAELTCPVALYTAASTSERIAFHTLNRATGHRVRRQFIDQETGKPVEADEQVKGYEVGQDEYIVLEPDEIAAAVPESDKTLTVVAFIRVRRHRYGLLRSPLLSEPEQPDCRGGLCADPRRPARQEGSGPRPHRPVPARPDPADPAAWRGPDRDDLELRLRGAIGRGGLPRRSGDDDQGRDARPCQAHHHHQAGHVRPQSSSTTAMRLPWPSWFAPSSKASRFRSARRRRRPRSSI